MAKLVATASSIVSFFRTLAGRLCAMGPTARWLARVNRRRLTADCGLEIRDQRPFPLVCGIWNSLSDQAAGPA